MKFEDVNVTKREAWSHYKEEGKRNSKVAVPTFAVENNHTVSDTGSEALGNSDIAIVTFACAE